MRFAVPAAPRRGCCPPAWREFADLDTLLEAIGERMDGRGPYCWLIAAGQARTGLQSIRTAIPGRWQPVPCQDWN